MSLFRYFSPDEFANANPSCDIARMDMKFMSMLDDARHIAGIPFVINSAYRSFTYEKAKGRSGTSSHVKGVAVDIKCTNGFNRLIIVDALLKVGFKRIGIHKHFIHVDNDKEKSSSIWLY